MKYHSSIILPLFFASIVSCGTDKKGDSSNVRVEFAKAEAAFALDGVTSSINPTLLKVRPIAVRVGTSNNGGFMVWGAKNCPGEEGKKEIDGKEYSYFDEHGCKPAEDNAWIDLTDGIDKVNATLNSQTWPVPPGDYSWVSMVMCADVQKADGTWGYPETSSVANLSFKAGSMTESREQFFCSPIGNYEAMTPVTIPEGGDITLEVKYDLSKLISYTDLSNSKVKSSSDIDDTDCYYNKDPLDSDYIDGIYCPDVNYQTLTFKIK